MTDRWKNRRKMAWITLLSGVAFPLLILGSESEVLGQIALPFYGFVVGVVMTYISAATYEDTKGVANVRPENDRDSLSSKPSDWIDRRVDGERMASEWENRQDDGGVQPSTRRSGKERHDGVGTASEFKRRGS
jgi:hypothetical protein